MSERERREKVLLRTLINACKYLANNPPENPLTGSEEEMKALANSGHHDGNWLLSDGYLYWLMYFRDQAIRDIKDYEEKIRIAES